MIKLNTPEIVVEKDALPSARDLQKQLQSLPLGEVDSSACTLVEQLQQINRCGEVSNRLKYINTIEPFCETICKNLAEKYSSSHVPLSSKNLERNRIYNLLHEEMAISYKILISELIMKNDAEVHCSEELLKYLYNALCYLSLRLKSAYSTYNVEPRGIWQELHQLYGLLEYMMHSQEGKKKKYHDAINSAKNVYLRIVLLSITNPYHLMHGEADIIYNLLGKWSHECSIHRFSGCQVNAGDLIVDLNHDVPPQFIFNDEVKKPKHCRGVNLDSLLHRIHNTASEVVSGECRSYNERLRRNMLLRLQSAWDERLMRGKQREVCQENISLVSGLSASHYYIDNKRVFIPEADEIELHNPTSSQENSSLSLIPEGNQPWKNKEQQHQAEIEAEERRLTPFEKHQDVWDKIYGSPLQAQLRDQESSRFKDHEWQKINESKNGMGLRCTLDHSSSVTVGAVIGFHPSEEPEEWQLGVIVWVKQMDNIVNIGVRCLYGTPKAIAIRSISGGDNTLEYFRGFILELHSDTWQIVVPSGIYDLQSKLVLNHRSHLQYVKLIEMCHATNSASIFTFEEIAIPFSEKQHIERIRTA